MTDPSPTHLLYVFDALCGWCYGFNPTLKAFAKTHDASVRVVSGGMIRGERRGELREVAGYIKQAYKVVEQRTDVKFGCAFTEGPLETGDMYMSSEPPAALLAWARERAPERQLDAAHALQSAIYGEGLGPSTPAFATYLAEAVDLDAGEAVAALTDPEYATEAQRDFDLTEALGVRAFPALFLEQPSGLIALANGFAESRTLEQRLAAAIA